jgi:uncharacterized protein
MFEAVEFPSEGATLRGRLYRPARDAPPCFLVMAHGTSATIRMVIDDYARAFHQAGFGVLLYDHRNLGESGGEPRQEINPWIQARGYRDAVAWLRRQADTANAKIALWGESYSATQVLVVGALLEGLAAVIAQIPVCGAALPDVEADDEAFALLKAIVEGGDVAGTPETTTGPLPVVSFDPESVPSLLTPVQAFRWFIEYGGRHLSGWQNRVSRVVPRTPVPFSPYLTAAHLRAPTLMMVGRNDEMVHCNRQVQQAVYDRIAGPKSLYEIEGGHFGLLWCPGPLFDEAAARQTDFLKSVLFA